MPQPVQARHTKLPDRGFVNKPVQDPEPPDRGFINKPQRRRRRPGEPGPPPRRHPIPFPPYRLPHPLLEQM